MNLSSSKLMPSKQPVLRWLASLSAPSTPSSTTPPSPSLVSLNEALHEPFPLPARPQPALLSSSKYLARGPPFLDNLTRSTLPTASLSPPLSATVNTQLPAPDPLHSPSIILNNSIPTVSSLDSLRSLSHREQKRSSSTSSHSATFKWAFLADPSQEEEVARPIPVKKFRSPKHPVVFCHGLLGFDSLTIGPAIAPLQVTHWRGIKEVLEENGTEVLITRVPATSSPIDRAKVLEETISKMYPGRSVHLIGHSMGGLDCRYLTTHLTHRKFSVLSITTIATPHRGSSFADHFLSTIGRTRMPSVLSLLDLLPNGGGDGKAFECLTIESMRQFNEETPDVPGVKYFSWGAVYEPGLIDTWKWPHSVILEKEGPNDGLVSVESSKWGTYLGTLSHVNHLDLVGWINAARYKWAEMMGKEIKFRPATFYLGIADMLAGEVDGVPKDGEPSEAEKGDDKVREALSETIAEGRSRKMGSTSQSEAGRTTQDVPQQKVQAGNGRGTAEG